MSKAIAYSNNSVVFLASGFLSTDPGWQNPYFTAAGQAEMRNWIAT